MTKLYRTGREYLGWLADAILAMLIVGAWFALATIVLAVLRLAGIEMDGMRGASTVVSCLAVVVWLGLRFVRTEAEIDGAMDALSDMQNIDADEIPY